VIRTDFSAAFQQLTGNPPFPWQGKLYEQFIGGTDSIPARCDIPTGLGKTSVIAIWLLAREACPSLPRRLVYVVNRRTVVDQTTVEVERYKLRRKDLAVSTLRGQLADSREWSADPSRVAVICGTVDMIGSRLLFSGYGVGFKGRPLHAGFLGQDALIVHDEAHLEPAFQELLLSIQREQRRGRSPDPYPLRVMELSATSRGKQDEVEAKPPFTLTPADYEDTVVKVRVNSVKRLHLVPQAEAKVGSQLAKIAIERFKDSGKAVIVFARTIEDVKIVVEALAKAQLPAAQLVGPMRGLERDRLTDPRNEAGSGVFSRFLPPVKMDAPPEQQWKVTPTPGTVYLVCTSAGEVGVNISADHLVCDLSTFESMAQRFGRVNRFGRCPETEIHVVHPVDFDKEDALGPARERTLALLEKLSGDASPGALGRLDAEERAAAFAPLPKMLPTSDILFDAWGMTSIKGKLPGRPPVEPYLHGVRNYEPPETQVAWREEVGIIADDLLKEHPPEELLEAYPLKPHELLGDRTDRVWKELVKLAGQSPESPMWIVDEQGAVEVLPHLEKLVSWDRKQAEARLGGRTVLLPHNVGGLTKQGMLDGNVTAEVETDETPVAIGSDVADVMTDPKGGLLRLRIWGVGGQPISDPDAEGMRLITRIDFPANEEDEDAVRRSWHWLERPIPRDNSRNAAKPVLLDAHVNDVVERANRMLANLTLNADPKRDAKIKNAVVVAALLHDLGKRRELWQRGIGRPTELAHVLFGKSGRSWSPREIGGYRHEFGSLIEVASRSEFQALDEEAKELVLHLIAAHHGQARPHFEAAQIIDPDFSTPVCEEHAAEIPRRFARLQRRFGRWGLAYLESLLRAADWAASAEPTAFFTGETK
jgi:CRISPR-associated endonuclease/helicase Cas3